MNADTAIARAMVDAIREMLGLEPLYAPRVRTDAARFGAGPVWEWPRSRPARTP